MNKITALFITTFITTGACTLVVPFSNAEDHRDGNHSEHHQQAAEHHSTPTTQVESLPAELRSLLSQEMLALEKGMMSIIPAYISGDWPAIAKTAEHMQHSYILKQNLSPEQAKILHSTLSPEFIQQDQNFHYLAGMLAHAAKHKKPELINFYFSEMTEACTACHTEFATHRFPALATDKKQQHKH